MKAENAASSVSLKACTVNVSAPAACELCSAIPDKTACDQRELGSR